MNKYLIVYKRCYYSSITRAEEEHIIVKTNDIEKAINDFVNEHKRINGDMYRVAITNVVKLD